LCNLPNAANSPFREPIVPGTKRPRTDAAYEKQPPAKKQIIETEDTENRRQAISRKVAHTQTTNGAAATAIMRKTIAKTTTKASQQVTQENLTEIRQWQRHYKKLFPQMVFYYDNVPDETRHKIGKQIQLLGSVSDCFCYVVTCAIYAHECVKPLHENIRIEFIIQTSEY
jgi:regulatory subunit for Cdc7p protein kinase